MIKMVLVMMVTKVICNVVMMKIMRLMSMGGFVTQERRSPINPPTTLLCNTLLHILTMVNMKTRIVRMMVMVMRMRMICVVITC